MYRSCVSVDERRRGREYRARPSYHEARVDSECWTNADLLSRYVNPRFCLEKEQFDLQSTLSSTVSVNASAFSL